MAKLIFYTNESVHIAVAEGLRRRGLKALTARDAGNLGLSDEEQIAWDIKMGQVHFPAIHTSSSSKSGRSHDWGVSGWPGK